MGDRTKVTPGMLAGLILLVVVGTVGCGNSSATEGPFRSITIGHIADLTGAGATAYSVVNAALDDLVDYFNEERLIPGVHLRVVTYDGQLDPANDIPGYEWLRERGADVIFTGIPAVPTTLKARVNADRMLLFVASSDPEVLDPPGFVFNLGTLPQHEAFTLLKWIAENDWDYASRGPAKIGGVGWDDAYVGRFLQTMEEYAGVHPDQFEWMGGRLTSMGTFTWGPEAEAFRNADYVFTPSVMGTFVKEYRAIGGTGKLLGGDPQAAFLGLITDAGLWDEIDGMLFIRSSRWWNEGSDMIALSKGLLYKHRPGDAERIMGDGVGYLSQLNAYVMLDIIAETVEEVGAENFDSEALYDVAQSYSLAIDGVDRFSFTQTKRWATNYFAPYVADGEREDIFRVMTEWLPAVTAP